MEAAGALGGTRPVVLVCSGLDPSGGAGFIADVRVAAALGTRPVGVITAMTVQSTLGVQDVQPVDPELVGAQLSALLGDVEVHAVKIGLIGSPAVARALASALALTAAPVVWDPIGAPSRGRAAFDARCFAELLELLAPHLHLITPNLDELGVFAGRPVVGRDDVITAARRLIDATCSASRPAGEAHVPAPHDSAAVVDAVGGLAVLVKAGSIADPETVVDLLITRDAVEELVGPKLAGGEHVHGTGCALATAIAAALATGHEPAAACRIARQLVAARIAAPVSPGRGAAAVV
jgi:hydroxymethylpyrimidine/phosphomethylpyrimidine kinase